MKCQKCNKNDANVQYRESVNGVTREIFLCSDCAKEAGILERTNSMFARLERSMIGAFARPLGGLLGGGFFGEPMAEIAGFFDSDPVEDMRPAPGGISEKKTAEPEPRAAAPDTADALKAKLLDAIAEERYEDAAKYRDEIKKLKGE